ncbi:hypothetical protein [Pseudomonas folii]|uniref:Uncharacterized protein n=1 Tax=Pseudomonas folii TaxID=2762593 RepID=A0ABR7B1D3_9PSED|nr:hypothetical protein [Pseudomonas folii]MBC3950974.1 hypothetical protein [Pseudomonas folii]
MKINNLPGPQGGRVLAPLVFQGINDSPDNPRLGLGYKQLSDPTSIVGLIAKLPEVKRLRDLYTLYWDDVIVQEYELDQTIIDKGWLSFSVPASLIEVPEGRVYYHLYSPVGNVSDESILRTIPVKRRVPGGLDPDLDTGINEGLLPCTVTPDPVSDVDSAVTVEVPAWIYQALGDELTVMWNNIRVNHPKLQALGPQSVIIPKNVLEQGGSSDHLLVNYEIRDIVDNYSFVSPPTYVVVEIDPDALIAARVREADRTTRVLDLVALGDNDAHVDIPSYIGNGKGYEVTLTWIGKTPTAIIELLLPPQRVDDPSFDHAQFTIPNPDIKNIAGGSAVVRYSLKQDDVTVEKKSRTTTITLTGLPVQLAEPVVDEANGTTVIDLADVVGPDVTVTIAPYLGQNAGDKVLLTWHGTPAQGAPVNYTDDVIIMAGEEKDPVIFKVGKVDNLDPLADGRLSLSYQVVFKVNDVLQPSPVAQYTVRAVTTGPVTGDESFESQPLGPLQMNTPLPFANGLTVTVTLAAGTTALDPNIPQFGNVALYCARGSKIKFEFGGTIARFLISHTFTSQPNTLEFFDSTGLVATHTLTIGSISGVNNDDFRLPRPCTYCELAVFATRDVMIDNLVWL